jgi:hypothetical protein
MEKIINIVNRISSIPLLIISVILFMSFILYVLPNFKAESSRYMADAGTLDLKFFSTPDTIYQIAEAYQEEGREKYILSKFTIDLAWPFVFTLLYLVFINLSFGYVHGPKWANLSVFALVTLVCDYIENFIAAVVMAVYPAKLGLFVWFLTFTTCLKWISMYFNSALFCYGLLAVPICFILRRRKSIDR